jgi:hypothetical protein
MSAVTAAGLARHERRTDPQGRAVELREASATRRLTSPERNELNDIFAQADARLRADLARKAAARHKAPAKRAGKSTGSK